jgi:hypothetical protein
MRVVPIQPVVTRRTAVTDRSELYSCPDAIVLSCTTRTVLRRTQPTWAPHYQKRFPAGSLYHRIAPHRWYVTALLEAQPYVTA